MAAVPVLLTVRTAGSGGASCELTNQDGTMARLSRIVSFAEKHAIPVMTVADSVEYPRAGEQKAG